MAARPSSARGRLMELRAYTGSVSEPEPAMSTPEILQRVEVVDGDNHENSGWTQL